MSHTTIYRDNFENMLLVTITGNIGRIARNHAIIIERMLQEEQQWEYSARYDVEEKTYVVFVKSDKNKDICCDFKSAGDSFYSLSARGEEYCLNCGTDKDKHPTNSGKLPIYC